MQKIFTILMLAGIVLSYGCASTQLKAVDLYEEPETYKRVQVLTDRLLRVMDRANMHKYRYSVIESDMPQAYAVCSNRTLLVYRGLLNDYSNNELMFILAHEISHIKFGHCQERKNASKSRIRKQELAADMEAVKVVQGYFGIPASEYIHVLSKLRAYKKKNGQHEDKAFDTHPAFKDRIREINLFYHASIEEKRELKTYPEMDITDFAGTPVANEILGLVISSENGNEAALHR